MGNLVLVALVGLAIGGGLGSWGGYEIATGRAAKGDLAAAGKAVSDAADTLDAARRQLDTTTRAVARAAARDAETASRHLSEAASYEQIITHAARAECERDPDSFGMLVDVIRRANRHVPDPGGGAAVSQALRPDAGADGSE